MKTALLLSGGMDSIAIAWWKRPDVAITIDYGQLPASAEITAATVVAQRLGIAHHVVKVDCRSLGSGDMAGLSANEHAPASDWWPYRNQMLVTFAAMKAISLDVKRLLIGSVLSDGFHRDGTPEFVGALSALLELQEGGMTVSAPAIELSTIELIRISGVPDTELAWAHSCHKSDVPCGDCRGCNKYFKVLEDLNNGMARPQES
ncbi:MAG: 7-cyano-7-deazaguanine synthase [Burkholderiales bacterium RIFCSPLOWO2_12_67_14]|jgi:7-cyano-7-deazaguanine synthase|nr:MAG: 7-cyano-7-deazaguanine synthase [Burkholderiales bacterium RIFCSPLOWO2_02_FULL_67_64]OGB47817.1 MAG: 7-cyano-7-deazaguanine synthase [Burkholderiales bacterium RIFCSPLOWO2_12_67_14]HCE28725.1 7-cyano-7-deazaguanine synthase [Comamonadaceae bacterium]